MDEVEFNEILKEVNDYIRVEKAKQLLTVGAFVVGSSIYSYKKIK